MNKIIKIVAIALIILVGVLGFKNKQIETKLFEEKQKYRKEIIRNDSLQFVVKGHYRKMVADTLTSNQLKDLVEEIIELKNRKPIYVTKTIIQPVEVLKETDSINVVSDSIFIKDYYPNKENPFLKYTNRTSIKTEKGISNFKFEPIELVEVVTEKEDGLYQIDFIGPDFLEVKSLSIQTEPILKPVNNNWGTIIGIEYGKNLDTKTNIFEINIYQRYKKFYIGGSLSSNKDIKGGIKIEL